MHIEFTDKRYHVIYDKKTHPTVQKIIAEALRLNLVQDKRTYFLGYGLVFFRKEENLIRTFRMRENWNGCHDVAVYQLPDWEEIGKILYADPPNGQHRDVWSAK